MENQENREFQQNEALQQGDIQKNNPLLELEIKLSEQEVFTCLQATSQSSNTRPIVQTVILLLLFIYCGAAYFSGGMTSGMSLFIALCSLAIIAAMWLVPRWHDRFVAKSIASEQPVVRLKLYENEIVFEGEKQAVIELSSCRPTLYGDLLILEIGREIVGIPRRVAGECGFSLLLEKFGMSGSSIVSH